jgi:hypothetical protein
MLSRSSVLGFLALVVVLAAFSGTAAAALPGADISATKYAPSADYPGLQKLHYEFGPIAITPGQNTIDFEPNQLKPDVPGYITSFEPNLVYTKGGKVPGVDVIHLHHGVWVINGYPTLAAGEEKTAVRLPQGYGLRHRPQDGWLMNYMIHNLTPTPTSVKLTYDIEFVPDSAAAAAGITPVKPLWMDVSGIKAYPIFDAIRGQGKNGRFEFPKHARGAQRDNIGGAQRHTVPQDMTLVGTAGHLHPGGLFNDLDVTRAGQTKRLFRSEAKYFEPAGAVSWDVSMTVTKPDWRIALKAGDVLRTSVTYDTRKASWYESMGIMVTFYAEGIRPEAVDPFAAEVDTKGLLTHGHLPENDNHGGDPFPLPDARDLLDGFRTRSVDIKDFVYGRGDLNSVGRKGRPPVVKKGKSITYTNLDATPDMPVRQQAYHTLTACKAPCNRSTGIAYPLANAKVQFDSGELGYGPPNATAAANRHTWDTPKKLRAGTYTYFCRIHPFMRGAFRVKK